MVGHACIVIGDLKDEGGECRRTKWQRHCEGRRLNLDNRLSRLYLVLADARGKNLVELTKFKSRSYQDSVLINIQDAANFNRDSFRFVHTSSEIWLIQSEVFSALVLLIVK